MIYKNFRNFFSLILAALLFAGLPVNSNASIFIQSQTLTGLPDAGASLGRSLAISGDEAIIGAPNSDFGGRVYFYHRTSGEVGWSGGTSLRPNDVTDSDDFGGSVAISNDTYVVGAGRDVIGANPDQGSAYVFVRDGSGWTQQAKLTASDGDDGDFFGFRVAISGDTIVVGAFFHQVGSNSHQGAAYVFVRNGTNWTLQATLTASDGAQNDGFGSSVAIDGSTVIVGARSDQIGADEQQGSAYIFTRSGTIWTQQAKLVAADGAAEDYFGYSADVTNTLNGAVAVVGAKLDDIGGNSDQGSVYVFTRSGTTWTQAQKLTASDGIASDIFGESVSITPITGSSILIGAQQSFDAQGKAYVFRRAGSIWTQREILRAADGAEGARFGESVAISGETAFIGASAATIGTNFGQGSAYVFDIGSRPFDFDGDGKTDLSIFRQNVGEWWYLKSSNGGNAAAQFGQSTDKITPGDFTGDGKTDIAFYRPSTGFWFVLRSEDFSFYSFPFGTSTDLPAVGDFDGDDKADAAVFRPSTATWYISKSSGGTIIQQFGANGDVPVVGDYDGDDKADIAIFRPSLGQWWINRSSNGTTFATTFGTSTDKPVPGDYTGDVKTDIAFWRPSSGEWFVLRSEINSFYTYYSFPFGTSGDIPAPGDFDGDGKTDATVFRPSTSTWYSQRTTAGTLIQQFGQSGDKPVPSAFVP